jgi:rubrerythrin
MEGLTVRRAVEMAINTEKIGADFYSKLSQQYAEDAELARIFERLSKDEKVHEAQFRALLDDAPGRPAVDSDSPAQQFLQATAFSKYFNEGSLSKIESAEEALGKALNFEKATLQYYEALRDIMGNSDKLQAIIDAEKDHVVTLMRVIVSDARFRSLQDRW